ncbi:hypothetical protein OE165_28505, partial [Escherichia coli]|uniref:hypothetical protein n=1 Tax=Escherichia coli TaxID=562 RepID=UPI0021F30926
VVPTQTIVYGYPNGFATTGDVFSINGINITVPAGSNNKVSSVDMITTLTTALPPTITATNTSGALTLINTTGGPITILN